VPLFVLLLVGTVGGAFTDVLIQLHLALKDVSAKGLRSWQVRARASVLTVVIASATMWVVAMASPLPRIIVGAPTGIEGVACIAMEAEMLMY
jgi:hypothetical protein